MKVVASIFSLAVMLALSLLPVYAAETANDGTIALARLKAESVVVPETPEFVPPERPMRRVRRALPAAITREKRERARGEHLPVIDGLSQPLTQEMLARYTTQPYIRWIENCLKNGEPYLAFIRGEVEKRGLPPELTYLPLIESGYTPEARSSAGALGMWQFMKNSVHNGMEIDEWRDDRRDFWKSTNAALDKLTTNYLAFGDWALALAAYNAGGGKVARSLKKTGLNDYWALSEQKELSKETIYYVPKLLAVAYIIENPRKFNLDICYPEEDYTWTRINLPHQVNLTLLARYAGVDLESLKQANSELSLSVTPPGAGYQLKVRRSDEAAVRAVLERKDIKLMEHYVYTIKSGDTLLALARYYGVSVDSIVRQNKNLNPRRLLPGVRIVIPALRDVAPYQNRREKQFVHDTSTWDGHWTVDAGDTLWSIAREVGTSPDELARVNGLRVNGTLRAGVKLRVP